MLKIFFKISILKKKICDFYSTRLVDHFDTKQVIICDKISILDFAYVSYLKVFCYDSTREMNPKSTDYHRVGCLIICNN